MVLPCPLIAAFPALGSLWFFIHYVCRTNMQVKLQLKNSDKLQLHTHPQVLCAGCHTSLCLAIVVCLIPLFPTRRFNRIRHPVSTLKTLLDIL